MKIRIWDLPLRLFHWLLVLAVIGSFISVKLGGNAMIWHGRLGYFVLVLLLFRVVWGFVGSYYARFAQFVKTPQAILDYLKNPDGQEASGHNPLGALSVLALIGLFLSQAIAGLFASDDIAFDGPLAKYVSSGWVEWFTTWHRWNEWVLLGLVALHLGAIFYYQKIKRINLIQAMVTGDKELRKGSDLVPQAQDDRAIRLRAMAIFIAMAAILYYFLR